MKQQGQLSPDFDAAEDGLLLSRPLPLQPHGLPAVGLQPLQIGSGRDGLLYVPQGYSPESPAPLVLALHGAGGDAHGGITLFLSMADESGLILLAPDSRSTTWDVIRGEYGPDISFIDRALAQTFNRYAVDPTHLAIEGFSDGASYAISVGLTNGDLFSHVIAFSPGFAAPAAQEDTPALFISHGTHDGVLPIDVCSRSIVPRLQRAGYDVLYREFEGGHTVPEQIAREAVDWFLAPEAPLSLP
jgi:phospholipase/carboxylesterase